MMRLQKKKWPWKIWKTRKKYPLKKFTNGVSPQIPHVKKKSMPVNKYKKCAFDETAKLPTKKPHKFWKTEFVAQTPIESLRPGSQKWRIFITLSDLFDQYYMSVLWVFGSYLTSIWSVFDEYLVRPARVPPPGPGRPYINADYSLLYDYLMIIQGVDYPRTPYSSPEMIRGYK